jgi:3-oxoacyl-[acyl-carrier protein] reductase
MAQRLAERTAIVTGAGRGIGRVIAMELAREGARVAVADVDAEGAQSVASEIESMGASAKPYTVNVASAAEVDGFIRAVSADFGSIDILVNNAGITRDNLMMRMKEEEWDLVLDVNLKSAFLCTKSAAKSLLRSKAGRIINITSVVGVIGNAGQANYSSSKAGMIGLTKSCAKEFASRGVTANAVAPGFIITEMTDRLPQEVKDKYMQSIPLGGGGEALDVAKAVVFLASDDARYITGQVIHVDGGMAI